MSDRTGDDVLAMRVRLHGIDVGRPVDLLLDRDVPRVVGIDVLCGDGVNRFLPLPTASVADREIAIESPLVLREEDDLAFYRSRTVALSAVRGGSVQRGRSRAGTLRDIVFGPDGELAAVVVEVDGQTERLPFHHSVRFAPASRSAA